MMIIELQEELRKAIMAVVISSAVSFGVNVTPERQIEIWDQVSKVASKTIYKELTGDDA